MVIAELLLEKVIAGGSYVEEVPIRVSMSTLLTICESK
jgi:hypothetical protein